MNLINEFEKVEEDYYKARMNLVIRWAEYVKTNPDKEWSKQHNIFINNFLRNLKQPASVNSYLLSKGEKCFR